MFKNSIKINNRIFSKLWESSAFLMAQFSAAICELEAVVGPGIAHNAQSHANGQFSNGLGNGQSAIGPEEQPQFEQATASQPRQLQFF